MPRRASAHTLRADSEGLLVEQPANLEHTILEDVLADGLQVQIQLPFVLGGWVAIGTKVLPLERHGRLEVVLEARRGLLLRCLLYTSPSPRDRTRSRMPSSA